MSNPFFSIVVPSFNQGQFLEECITSIIFQDFQDFELILMDGGSTDSSLSIIKKYQSSFSHWQSCIDNGQSDAIAKGFLKAKGRYFLWLNSDDILQPKALSLYHRHLTAQKNIHFLYANMFLISPNSKQIGRRLLTPLPPLFARLSINAGLFGFYQPASVWSASAYYAVGGINPQLQFALDNELFVRIIGSINLDSIVYLDKCTAGFRVHPAQKTLNISSVGLEERRIFLISLPYLNRNLLHLWVRLWRFCSYSFRGKLLMFFSSRFLIEFSAIP